MFRRIGSILAIAALSLMAAVVPAQAQTLTNGQQLLLCNACKANPACNVPRLAGGQTRGTMPSSTAPAAKCWP